VDEMLDKQFNRLFFKNNQWIGVVECLTW
jgi:hypothetical protein